MNPEESAMRLRHLFSLFLATSLSVHTACSDDDVEGGGNEEEVITTITLSFTPAGGGEAVTAAFDDADGDGGEAPTVDPINLATATTYDLTVRFQNKLETPAEEITDEVRDESDEHQLFFTGTAVNGPASDQPGAPLAHTYSDADGNGLPVGLSNAIVTTTGTGTLTVVLRHLPPVNDVAVKTAELASTVRADGLAALPGESDVQVDFAVTVP
jgi:hypothetical protein